MQKALITKKLQLYACHLRLGRSLEVMESLVDLLVEILSQIDDKNGSFANSIGIIFSSILACQQREDWLGLADYLEYDLIKILWERSVE